MTVAGAHTVVVLDAVGVALRVAVDDVAVGVEDEPTVGEWPGGRVVRPANDPGPGGGDDPAQFGQVRRRRQRGRDELGQHDEVLRTERTASAQGRGRRVDVATPSSSQAGG